MEAIKTFLLDRKAHLAALALAVLMMLGQYTPKDMTVPDVPPRDAGATRVISFNLRCKDDIFGSVKNRASFILAALKAYVPDSFGVQEATAKWLGLLDEGLGENYARVGVGRDSTKNTEYSAVYYRTDKFDLLDSGTRWLSETPEKAGSKSFLSSLPRICTWATLKDKQTGKIYTHLNTHLDHVLESTREQQAKVLVEQVKALEEKGVVVCTGDFNTEEGAKAYKVVAGALDDTKMTAAVSDSGPTFHDYGRLLGAKKKPIDFIFVTCGTAVQRYKIIDHKVDGMYLSDHYGLCSDIVI